MSHKEIKNYGIYTRCVNCKNPIKIVGQTQSEIEVESIKESYLSGKNKLRCEGCGAWRRFELVLDTINLETNKREIGIVSRYQKNQGEIENPEDIKPEHITI